MSQQIPPPSPCRPQPHRQEQVCAWEAPESSLQGLGLAEPKHLRASGLNTHGQMGTQPREATPAAGHTARLRQGRPPKRCQHPRNHPRGLQLAQLEASGSDLGQRGTGAGLRGPQRGRRSQLHWGGGGPASQQWSLRRPLALPAEASDPITSSPFALGDAVQPGGRMGPRAQRWVCGPSGEGRNGFP